MSIIHIVSTIDCNYLQHFGVMLCSLFENNRKHDFKIHLILNFDSKDLRKIHKLIKKYNQQLVIIKIDDSQLLHFRISDHVTIATYYRILIPSLIDPTLTKVLYLDTDIIIKEEIIDLWNVSLEENIIAAVEEPLFARYEELGIPREAKYFNAGVMLLNLDQWRKNDITSKTIKYIRENAEKLQAWDQDALNAIIVGKWLSLELKWNVTTLMYKTEKIKFDIDENILEYCLSKPAIIHYSSKFKPWHYWCDHPLKAEYYCYLKLTPWKNFQLTEDKFWHKVKQNMKRALNLIYGREIYKVYN